MAIDKESSGLPEIDPHRATTKVNLGMVFMIGLFFAFVLGLVVFFAHRENENATRGQSAPIESQPSR